MKEIEQKNLKALFYLVVIVLALAVAARVARAGNIDSIVKNENTAAKASHLNSRPRHCLLLSIHGTLSEDGTLEIPPIFRFKGYYEPPGSGDYYVEAHSDTKLLSKTYFRAQFHAEPLFGPPEMREALLAFTVPYDDSLTKLVFKHKQKILKEIVRTEIPPKIKLISFSEHDNIINLKFHYSDPDGEDIACRVELACDNRDYEPAAVAFLRCSDFPSYNLDMSNFPPYMEIKNLDLSHFPGGDKCCLRIEISDGINIGRAYSPRFSLDNHPPKAYIRKPEEGSIYNSKDMIFIEGFATDQEDKSFDKKNLEWYLDNNPEPSGKGRYLIPSDLKQGKHTIKLKATDSKGATVTTERSFIVDDNIEPDIYIKNMKFNPPQQTIYNEQKPEYVFISLELFSTKQNSKCNVTFYKDNKQFDSGEGLLRANSLTTMRTQFKVTKPGINNIKVVIDCNDKNKENNVIQKSYFTTDMTCFRRLGSHVIRKIKRFLSSVTTPKQGSRSVERTGFRG